MDRYIGKRLDGRYEIKEIIGVGGMAVVYKAYDTIESRIVAIKILKSEFVSNEDFVRRFKNESKAIAVLSHANIVKVYDVSFGDLIQYIVMEYIDGITLKQYIETNGSIPWKNTVSIVMQILRALQHAHDKGIIHRDVKPQNIMITRDGTIKVTDFGIARFARNEHKTMTDKAIGSVHYISPEQARSETTDEKADIYSVGVIMYEMLSGTLPFQAESAVIVAMMQLQNEAKPLREIDPTIPLGLAQITMNAMEKEPLRRYQTAAEMLCDLETFRRDPSSTFERNYYVDNAPTKFVESTEDESAAEEKEEPNKKRTWIPILTGVMVGVAILVALYLVLFVFGKMNTSTAAMECPNFVGMNYEEINEKYPDKFTFDITYEETSIYEVGEVIKQTPAPKTSVKKKDKIKLTVATSAERIKVPDVVGAPEARAIPQLKQQGFKNITIETAFDDVTQEGAVIKTEPAKDSEIYPDTEIIVYISKGKEILLTEVPDLFDCLEDSAEGMLKNAKLELGSVTSANSSKPKGYIISQSPSAESQVEEGTKVNIVVSTGENVSDYSMNVTVNLPSDCEFNNGYIVAELESGEKVESPMLTFSTDESYTFTVTSASSTDYLTVIIMDSAKMYEYDYQKLKLNFSKKSYTVTSSYDSYPKVSE